MSVCVCKCVCVCVCVCVCACVYICDKIPCEVDAIRMGHTT